MSSVTSICQPLCLALVNSTSFVNPSHIQTVKTTAHSQSTVCNIALLLDFLCMGNIKFSLCILCTFLIFCYTFMQKTGSILFLIPCNPTAALLCPLCEEYNLSFGTNGHLAQVKRLLHNKLDGLIFMPANISSYPLAEPIKLVCLV